MPLCERPDGARIHWEARGHGPLVVTAPSVVTEPAAWEELVDELARDHRAVTYDRRGTGESSEDGPYSVEADASDLGAVIGVAGGGDAVVVAGGDAATVAINLAAYVPELVRAVVVPGGPPLPPKAVPGSGGFAGSVSVVGMLVEQLRRDYRAALRSIVAGTNPDLSDAEVDERLARHLDYSPQGPTLERALAWVGEDSAEPARALGHRLVVLFYERDPWLPGEAVPVLRRLLPDARIESVQDDPISRPELTAEWVRRIASRTA